MHNNTSMWKRLGLRSAALLLCAVAVARAQVATPQSEPVRDNSFLVEEAFNQPAGVVQHVLVLEAPTKGGLSFTLGEEWPIRGMRHQFSFSVPVQRPAIGGLTGVGDVGLHYRYQLLGVSGGRTYLAPRMSVLLPTGDEALGTGAGGATIEALAPLTLEFSRVSFNANLGGSLTPRARDGSGIVAATNTITAGGSAMWATTRTFNLLLEALWNRETTVAGLAERGFTVSSGFRWAQDFAGGTQLVRGVAYSITRGSDATTRAVILYLSIEHAFSR